MRCFEGVTGWKKIGAIIGMAIMGIIFAGAMGLLFGFVVMWLWNWLMPSIFGLGAITFWQAWGLVVLTHILFKCHNHHPHHRHNAKWKSHFKQKFHEHHSKSPCCSTSEEDEKNQPEQE
jgi:hypothetical protein